MDLDTVLYCRVSTDNQADNGHGRDHQEEVLKTKCGIKKYGITRQFLEDYSAKDFNRPEWIKLEKFVKANKGKIKRVLFTKWDRFSRNMEEALRVIKLFRSWGVTLNAVEQPLDLEDPNNKVMLAMYLIMPEVENDNISSRTKDGMYRAAKEGAFLGTPPFGYTRVKYDKYASMIPNDDALLIQEIFERVSLGFASLEGIRKEYFDKGYNKVKQSFYNMLRNRAYIGQVKVPEYKGQEPYWINGLHDSIVDSETFAKVQDVLIGKRRNAKPPSKKNEALPLRGMLECGVCGNTLTGSISKGNGGKYGYYHCRGKCKNRIPTKLAEKLFKDDVLRSITVNENVLELYKEIIIDVQRRKLGYKATKIDAIKNQISETKMLIEKTEDKYADDQILPERFEGMITRYEQNLMNLNAELQVLQQTQKISRTVIDKAVDVLRNIPLLFTEANYEQKTELLGLIFPEKLIISKKECRTKSTNVVIELLCRVNAEFKRLGTKKAINNDGLSNLAPQTGLEPVTL